MMIFVDGLEEAIVGWANIGKFQIAVYSVDRLSNIIYEDMENEVSTKDVDEIIEHLELQVSEQAVDLRMPPPIFVRTGDWEDIQREILRGQ